MNKYKAELEKISSWAEMFTHWDKLRSVQNSKIINSTYIWLFIVPLTAKFLSKLNDSVKIMIDGNVYEFILKLPFSWEQFFYSSLCFVVGNIIFIIMAPELIKDFKDYGDYIRSGRDIKNLSKYMAKEYEGEIFDKDMEIHYADLESTRNLNKAFKRNGEDGKIIDEDDLIKDHEKYSFWKLYNYLNAEYYIFRYICATLYAIGFILFSFVIAKNILWVLSN